MSLELNQNFDVVIVGAGPAGASAAIRLAQSGVKVLLVEQKKFPREKLCGEFISPECLSHFKQLGVFEEMLNDGVVLRETVFYARNGKGISIPSEWLGLENNSFALGLSRAEMDARLLMRAREVGVEVLEETQAVGLVVEDKKVCGVRLRNQQEPASMANGKRQTGDSSPDSKFKIQNSKQIEGEQDFELTENQNIKSDEINLVSKQIQNPKSKIQNPIIRQSVEFVVKAKITIDATGRGRVLARRVEKEAESRKRAEFVAFKTHLEGASIIREHCEIYVYNGGYGGCNHVEKNLYNLCFIVSAKDAKRFCNAEEVMRKVVFNNRRAGEAMKQARVVKDWQAVAIEKYGRGSLSPAEGLFTVGDAAAFIDPFTGSGILLALESAKILVAVITKELRRLSEETFKQIARDYRKEYSAAIDSRLRFCSLLRHVAFVPLFAETTIRVLSFSDVLRQLVARATRRNDAVALK